MTRRRLVALVLVGFVTAVAYVLVLVVTGFVACGISGCSGGGFGPSFAPVQAQVGLVIAGLVPLPATLLLLAEHPWRLRAAGAAASALAGAGTAMVLLGLGPDGCPAGQGRAVTGPDAFQPGVATCSADRDAVRSAAAQGV